MSGKPEHDIPDDWLLWPVGGCGYHSQGLSFHVFDELLRYEEYPALEELFHRPQTLEDKRLFKTIL